MLYDHADVRVSNLEMSRSLFSALLPAMGFTRVVEDADSLSFQHPDDTREPFFGVIVDSEHQPNGTRLAFRAEGRGDVDRLAAIALHAGAQAYEAPALCEEYSPSYYATFFEDRDGNKFEICYRERA